MWNVCFDLKNVLYLFFGGVPDASKKRPINWRSKQQLYECLHVFCGGNRNRRLWEVRHQVMRSLCRMGGGWWSQGVYRCFFLGTHVCWIFQGGLVEIPDCVEMCWSFTSLLKDHLWMLTSCELSPIKRIEALKHGEIHASRGMVSNFPSPICSLSCLWLCPLERDSPFVAWFR